jgi:maltose O-acetyltransferase
MLAGELYDPGAPELAEARARARRLTARYNRTGEDERDERAAILRELIGELGEKVWIEPPFSCDYGENIALAERVFLNFGCVVLDCARVSIGAHTMLGPSVQIYAATHPVDPDERASGLELARPVTIGADVWVGGAAVIGPGVAIGDGATVGAGSVVVADVPPRTVVAGNPARELRRV